MSDQSSSIYLDHAATTVIDPEVKRVMKQYLDRPLNANPSSRHRFGMDMQQTIRSSKHQISSLLGISNFREKNIVFTSGATEANNLIIFGHCLKSLDPNSVGRDKHVVVGPSEHDCVREAVIALSKNHGFKYSVAKLLENGQLDMEHFETILSPNTILVCQMAVSNIFGTIYDVEGVAKSMKKICPNALLHVDSVQAIGKIDFKISRISSYIPTTISLSAHKIHGPKGIGLLAFDHPNPEAELEVKPLAYGGGQEHGNRPGTENLLGIIALAKSLSRAQMETGSSIPIFQKLRKLFREKIDTLLPDRKMCWIIPEGLTHNAIISLVTPTVPAEVVFNHLVEKQVYVSVGSACQAKEGKLSPALVQRFSEKEKYLARHVLRISFCRFTTEREVERAVTILSKILPPLHHSSPLRKKEDSAVVVVSQPSSSSSIIPPPPPPTTTTKSSKLVIIEEEEEEEEEEEGEEIPTKRLSGKKRKKKKKRERKKLVSDDFSNLEFSRILCRVGELALKKKNRKIFESQLAKNIRVAIKPICPNCVVDNRDRRCYVTPTNISDRHLIPKIAQRLTRVFGLVNVSLCFRVKNEMDVISQLVENLSKKRIEAHVLNNQVDQPTKKQLSFKIFTKRANKRFPLKSMDVSRQLGAVVLRTSHLFKVDLKNPEFEIGVDIRGEGTYIYTDKIMCCGGLPVGTTGKGVTLLSGGIDSPVASWLMMKRGMSVNYVSFYSFPYTSQQYVVKLKRIGQKLAQYQQPPAKMFLIPLTKIQEAIRDNAKPESYRTVLYRRAMNRIGCIIAKKIKARCLVTGESLGQVASQTIPNIVSIMKPTVECDSENPSESNLFPIFRPLIGSDKGEIIEIAKQIGTYEISNVEAADTCTLFKPRAPVIYSKVHIAENAEKMVPNYKELVEDAIKNMTVLDLKCNMFEEEVKKKDDDDDDQNEYQPAKKKRKLDEEEEEEEVLKKK